MKMDHILDLAIACPHMPLVNHVGDFHIMMTMVYDIARQRWRPHAPVVLCT